MRIEEPRAEIEEPASQAACSVPPVPGPARRLWCCLTASARREALVAGVLAVALFLAGTSATPIFGRDEARFSQAAREMLARGDLIVPTFAGSNRYHKPILIYWCTMASYRLLGVSERAARLPSNLAGAMVIALLAATARRRWGPGSGLLAALLLAATPVVWLQARVCTADMVLLLPTLVVMLAFERLVDGRGSGRTAAVFWIAMGLAILAKGPIAPMWVVCTALALWAIDRSWRRWEVVSGLLLATLGLWKLGPAVLIVPAVVASWRLLRSPAGRRAVARLRPAWGLPLLLAITLPWAVAATLATDGAFLREAVGEHVVGRSLRAFESHGFFPGFYLVSAVVVAFPWFGPLLGTLRSRWRADLANRYLVAWLVGPLVMLELVATKLVHYWMPSYPAGVLLVVGGLWAARQERPWRLGSRLVLAAGGATLAAVLAAAPFVVRLPELRPFGVAAAAVLLGATGIGTAWLVRRPVAAMAAVGAGGLVALLIVALAFLPELGRHSLGPATARAALAEVRPDEEIVVFKPRDEEVYFYLPVGVRTCAGAGCLAKLRQAEGPFLVLARSEDFELLRMEWPAVRLEIAGRVEGLDVGHGRRREQVLFRPRAGRDRPAGAPAGVDRHGGAP